MLILCFHLSVGGYIGNEIGCETPGISAFNMSSLQWSSMSISPCYPKKPAQDRTTNVVRIDQFTALTGERALQAWDGKDDNPANPLGQQMNQRGFDSKAGLEGSYGYTVPEAVQKVIGGDENGGATLTAPVQTPTEGPFKKIGRAHV